MVTSALPYVNGIKHIGNITGSLLPADVFARFLHDAFGASVPLVVARDFGQHFEFTAQPVITDLTLNTTDGYIDGTVYVVWAPCLDGPEEVHLIPIDDCTE